MDYCVNPYTGCLHGCIYCYAVFMKKFTDHEGEWGTFVDAKVNCCEVLAGEVARKTPGKVILGSVTDAYQHVEEEFELTRGCLELLLGTEFEVSILTKSDLILRDRRLIAEHTNLDVGFTITTMDDDLALVFEPGAPPPSRRLNALAELSRDGVDTWAFLGPIIPGVSDNSGVLRDLLCAFKDAGARRVLIDSMNFRHPMRQRVAEYLRERSPHHHHAYLRAMKDPGYKRNLLATIHEAISGIGIPVDVCFQGSYDRRS